MKGKNNKHRLVANDLVLAGYEMLLLTFSLKLFPMCTVALQLIFLSNPFLQKIEKVEDNPFGLRPFLTLPFLFCCK
jgi:hypothetical protein